MIFSEEISKTVFSVLRYMLPDSLTDIRHDFLIVRNK